jgi:hypothetical protein
MTLRRYIAIVLGGFAVITAISVAAPMIPSPNDDPNSRSVGWLPQGRCMSGPMADERARMVVSNTDWTRIEGAATYGRDVKALIGAVKVFDEMKRLGTQPCPDLRPLFESYPNSPTKGKH